MDQELRGLLKARIWLIWVRTVCPVLTHINLMFMALREGWSGPAESCSSACDFNDCELRLIWVRKKFLWLGQGG